MATLHHLEDLLRTGLELTQAKRFREAVPILTQALQLEPRHTGAAYLLSLCFYFTGAFAEAKYLFGQLTNPRSPLEAGQRDKLNELSRYADYEILRTQYWQGLKLAKPQKIYKEIRKRNLEETSLEAFHLFLVNQKMPEWKGEDQRKAGKCDVQVTTRAGRKMLFQSISDADQTIGAHFEAMAESKYIFLPFTQIRVLELGLVKRWITAQVEFRKGQRGTMLLPLTYRESMEQTARGVQEGLETILQSWDEEPAWTRAFGQKQFRSASAKIGLTEILRFEFDSPR